MFMTEHWLKALNEGKIVGTVMVEFRKAFDLADHSLLLTFLKGNSRFTNVVIIL